LQLHLLHCFLKHQKSVLFPLCILRLISQTLKQEVKGRPDPYLDPDLKPDPGSGSWFNIKHGFRSGSGFSESWSETLIAGGFCGCRWDHDCPPCSYCAYNQCRPGIVSKIILISLLQNCVKSEVERFRKCVLMLLIMSHRQIQIKINKLLYF
jgi:hypothetical protein